MVDLTAIRRWLAAEAEWLRGNVAAARAAIVEARAAIERLHDRTTEAMVIEALNELDGRCTHA